MLHYFKIIILTFICDVCTVQSTLEYIDESPNSFIITSPQERSNGNIYFNYIHLENSGFYGGVRSLNADETLVNDLLIKPENRNNEVLQIELFEEEETIIVLSSQYSFAESKSYINLKSLYLNLSILSTPLYY